MPPRLGLDVTRATDGRYAVIVRGLDVFDPTTGEVSESSTADIACWFGDWAAARAGDCQVLPAGIEPATTGL